MKALAWVIGAPVGALLLMMLIGSLSGPPSQRSTDRLAVELCWKDQEKKSLAPDEARTVAGWCETMERDFKTKYGSTP